VAEGGPDALSVRAVAEDAGTTTRAVYSLFGSKAGLLVGLAEQAVDYLRARVEEFEETAAPAADLVAVGAEVYRSFVLDHPSLFRIAFQRIVPELPLGPEFFDKRAEAFATLEAKVERLEAVGQLGGRSVREAAVEFNAMCEGLANAELRGGTLRTMPKGKEQQVWMDAFGTLVRGFAVPRG
jgi:AcrR family transcriptional regulator